MNNSIWDSFFGNPIISSYLTESDEQAAMQDQQAQGNPDVSQSEDPQDIDQLAEDLRQGAISQEDLIGMYKTGKISKEDIESIIQQVENPPAAEGDGQDLAPDQEPTEEELLAQQVDQTNDLFVKFSIYDKITELTDKLNYFKDNFEDIQSETYNRVLQLREFLNILSSLVFNIETAVAYQMYGSILLQLTEIFEEYNKISGVQKIKDSIRDEKNKEFRSGQLSADPVDRWAADNKSHLMPKDTSEGMSPEDKPKWDQTNVKK